MKSACPGSSSRLGRVRNLPHLTSSPKSCHATPHTPRGVVVWQLQCPTCRTLAKPQVWQVWLPLAAGRLQVACPSQGDAGLLPTRGGSMDRMGRSVCTEVEFPKGGFGQTGGKPLRQMHNPSVSCLQLRARPGRGFVPLSRQREPEPHGSSPREFSV
jgi:hypothetical protein